MQTQNKLRGLVVAQYGNVRNFANAIGWSEAKTYRIVAGTQEPEASEIVFLADRLKIEDPDMIVDLFLLPWRSHFANN